MKEERAVPVLWLVICVFPEVHLSMSERGLSGNGDGRGVEREAEKSECVGNPMPSSPWPERYYRDLTRNPSPPLREILSSSYHSTIALLQLPAHYFITPWHLDPDHPFETSPQVWRSSYVGTLSYRTLPHPSSGQTNSALINGAIPNAYNLQVMYEERLASGR